LLGWPAQPAYAQLAKETITPAAARAITKEAYSYGFPLVDNDRREGEDGALQVNLSRDCDRSAVRPLTSSTR